ncbi:MAG: DUF433 domain-containing protein [Chloroflexota bacterium]
MTRGQPFNIRLDEATERLVEAEAKRTRRSKSAVVQALTEEAARTRRFPGIVFRGDDAQRRPSVIGTGLDVWEVLEMLQHFGSPDALVDAMPSLTLAQIRLAQAYRDAYPREIADAIAENDRSIGDVPVLYPFVQVVGR